MPRPKTELTKTQKGAILKAWGNSPDAKKTERVALAAKAGKVSPSIALGFLKAEGLHIARKRSPNKIQGTPVVDLANMKALEAIEYYEGLIVGLEATIVEYKHEIECYLADAIDESQAQLEELQAMKDKQKGK